MKTDRQPITAKCPVGHFLDQTPIKPLRRCSHSSDSSKTEKTVEVELLSLAEDDSDSDHTSVFSDITDPSAFDSLNNTSFDGFFSNIDSSWRQGSLDVSMRVEALGPLEEEQDNCEPLELFVRENIPPSSEDRAAFLKDCNDRPPQLATRKHSLVDRFEEFAPDNQDKPMAATRRHSSMEFTLDSQQMEDRFEEIIASKNQDKLNAFQKPSYTQKKSLVKLAEAFKSGCPAGTHTNLLKKYPNTFVGSEAVDFMLRVNLASTREDAVFLGQRFCKELNLFHHIRWDHTFKDGPYFYKFINDSDSRCLAPIRTQELSKLSEKFVEGMHVSRHMSSRFKSYSKTFSGEEAVDYMLHAKLASNRPTAVFLGQRMMEELDTFESVAHKNRFKDSSGHLYRFFTGDDHSSIDESTNILSLMESVGAQHHQYIPMSPLPPTKATRSSFTSATVVKRKNVKKVSFGFVQSRYFERRLECNPATTSGPSLGLGREFYDDPPVPLNDANIGALKLHGGRLPVQDRTEILREWGYSKSDIKRATRIIKIVREHRKRSFNKDRKRY